MKQKVVTFFTIIFLSSLLCASFGPEVAIYKGEHLKWIDDPVNYFVMFKSNLDENYNCVDDSEKTGYSLDISHVPGDTYIERAFLIWTGTVHKGKIAFPPDNEVLISFNSTDGQIKLSQTVTGLDNKITDPNGFHFSRVRNNGFNTSYYIHRVDVTDFFNEIQQKGRDLGLEYDGFSLFGDYLVSELNCFSNKDHPEATLSDWSIVLIYSSTEISPKNIYIFDNFQHLRNEYLESKLSGFDMNREPEIQMTFINHLGNYGIPSVPDINTGKRVSEGIWVKGNGEEWLTLEDKCNTFYAADNNFTTLDYTDIFNSISSVFGWADREKTCVGGTPPVLDDENIEKNIEADTFIMDASVDGHYAAHFEFAKQIKLKYGANVDDVLTDLVIISTDQLKPPDFHTIGKEDIAACTPSKDENGWCHSDLNHTFAIRLQNWGERSAYNIKVQTELPFFMNYVEGSTEYAAELSSKNGELVSENWINIPDGEGGAFPLTQPTLIFDELNPCDPDDDYLSCKNAMFLRFSVKIDSRTPVNEVFEMVAYITVDDFPTFKTNLGIPVKLKFSDNCLENQEDIDMSECGGSTKESETPDEDAESTQDTELIDDSGKKSDGCSVSLI